MLFRGSPFLEPFPGVSTATSVSLAPGSRHRPGERRPAPPPPRRCANVAEFASKLHGNILLCYLNLYPLYIYIYQVCICRERYIYICMNMIHIHVSTYIHASYRCIHHLLLRAVLTSAWRMLLRVGGAQVPWAVWNPGPSKQNVGS